MFLYDNYWFSGSYDEEYRPHGTCIQYYEENGKLLPMLEGRFEHGECVEQFPNNIEYEQPINENNNNYNEEAQFKNIDEIGNDIKAKVESFQRALSSYFNNHKDPTNEEYRKKIFGSQNTHRNDSVLKDTLASFLHYNPQIANMNSNTLTIDIISNVATYVEEYYIYAWSHKNPTSKFILNENLKQKLVNTIYNLYNKESQGDNLEQSLSNLINVIDNISLDLNKEKQFLLDNQNNQPIFDLFCQQLQKSIEGDIEGHDNIMIPLDNKEIVSTTKWTSAQQSIVNAIKDIIKDIPNKIMPINKHINTNNQLLNINNNRNDQVNPSINVISSLQPNNQLLNINNNENIMHNTSGNNTMPQNNGEVIYNNIRQDSYNLNQSVNSSNSSESGYTKPNNLNYLQDDQCNNLITDLLNRDRIKLQQYRDKYIKHPHRFQKKTNVCWFRRLFGCCSNQNEIELDNIVRQKINNNAVTIECNSLINEYMRN